MPVRSFPNELLQPEPEVVIHMTAMGEADAVAAAKFFRGNTARMVWISSGDVYLAYGRFTGTEPGPVETALLTEESPLRSAVSVSRPGEISGRYCQSVRKDSGGAGGVERSRVAGDGVAFAESLASGRQRGSGDSLRIPQPSTMALDARLC